MQQHFAPSQAELRNEWMFNGWMLTVVPAKSALITEIRRTVISEATVDSGPPHGRRDREHHLLLLATAPFKADGQSDDEGNALSHSKVGLQLVRYVEHDNESPGESNEGSVPQQPHGSIDQMPTDHEGHCVVISEQQHLAEVEVDDAHY